MIVLPAVPATPSTRSATHTGARSSSRCGTARARCARSPTRLPISRPAVSRHLRLLGRRRPRRDAPRGTRRLYPLQEEGVEAVRAYLEEVWGDAAARFRLAAENLPRRARTDDDRAAAPLLRGRLPADHAFRAWTERDDDVVAGRPHDERARPARPSPSSPSSAAASSSGRRPARRSTGARSSTWEPPRRLAYLWHIRADRADATEVEITFDDRASGRAGSTIEHRGWERLGARGAGPPGREPARVGRAAAALRRGLRRGGHRLSVRRTSVPFAAVNRTAGIRARRPAKRLLPRATAPRAPGRLANRQMTRGETDMQAKPAGGVAARAGRWSARHRKTAIFGWLAFVVISLVIGGTSAGTKAPTDRPAVRRRVPPGRADARRRRLRRGRRRDGPGPEQDRARPMTPPSGRPSRDVKRAVAAQPR